MNYYVDLCFNCSRRSRNYHRFAYLSISRNNYCFIAFYCAFPHPLMLHHNKKKQKFTNCCSSYIRTIIQGEREIIILSIISTLCCCLPFGVVGIVFSAKINSAMLAGNLEEAQNNAKMARIWIIVSFAIGLLTWLIYMVLIVTGAVSGSAYYYY